MRIKKGKDKYRNILLKVFLKYIFGAYLKITPEMNNTLNLSN